MKHITITPDAFRQTHKVHRQERIAKAHASIEAQLIRNSQQLVNGEAVRIVDFGIGVDFPQADLDGILDEYRAAGWLIEEKHEGDFAPNVPNITYVFRLPEESK